MELFVQHLRLLFAGVAVALLAAALVYAGVKALADKVRTLSIWRLPPMVLSVLAALALNFTIIAQKDRYGNGGQSAPQQESSGGESPQQPRSVETNTLHFTSIIVHTNDLVTLSVAWPSNLFAVGTTIDIFASTSLVDPVWNWLDQHQIDVDETNWTVTVVKDCDVNFYRARERADPDDMRDTDGDTIPDVYEIHNGTNPYIPDYASAPKLAVGPDGAFASIDDAVAASEPYSIVEIDPSVTYTVTNYTGTRIPQHPVMVTTSNRYAVVKADGLAAFMLSTNTTSRTIFRNLYLLLDARKSFQVGFWCGGNLPFAGVAASATFENIYVRMPNPDVQYRGWLFYRSCADPAMFRDCTLNAAGATWALGVDAYGSPPLLFDGCTFIHFPPDGESQTSCGVLLRSSVSSDEGSDVVMSRTLFDESFTNAWPIGRLDSASPYSVVASDCLLPRAFPAEYPPDATQRVTVADASLSWSGIPLANSPSVALGIGAFAPLDAAPSLDSDGDTISDYDEAYEYGTDPYLADSDNDGVSDGGEIDDETDPTNPHSFTQTLDVTATNKVSLSHAIYVAWGYSAAGWEANELEVFPTGFGSTNYINASSLGATHMKAFCDLNDNGEYDVAHDILLVRPIPYGSTAQIDFVFGDVDGDGVADAQERSDGTDPHDAKNFRLTATLDIESSDVAWGLTNYVACGLISAGWSAGENSSFVGSTLQFPVDAVATNGEVFVKVFRDFNANGIYDAGVDALVVQRLTGSDRGKSIEFLIGDSDGDHILDSIELEEGTNPLSGYDYCFNLSLTYTGVFHTTNALTFTAFLGTNLVYGPYVVEGGVWAHDFGHQVAAAGERVLVNVWDDANHNGEWDTGETSNRYTVAITSHDMVVTNSLSYGNFDRDNNMLPDWWEEQTGLNMVTNGGAYADPDGDGLINVYEYRYGFNPLVFDATNTLLSVASRSIDLRIVNADPVTTKPKFIDYAQNGSNGVFEVNVSCWAADIDSTCASMWQSYHLYPGDEMRRTGTLITPRHMIGALHYHQDSGSQYFFKGRSGTTYVRTLVSSVPLLQFGADTDIRIGLLDEELPTNDVMPAVFLPANYKNYIGDGKWLPCLFIDQEEKCIVQELDSLPVKPFDKLLSGLRPKVANRQSFYEDCIGGDSSSPRFLVVGNRAVLLNVMWKGGPGTGSFVTLYADLIQETIDSLYSGYSLDVIDLSQYQQLIPQEGN